LELRGGPARAGYPVRSQMSKFNKIKPWQASSARPEAGSAHPPNERDHHKTSLGLSDNAVLKLKVEGWGAPNLWAPSAPPSRSTEFSKTSVSSQLPIISVISPPDRADAAR